MPGPARTPGKRKKPPLKRDLEKDPARLRMTARERNAKFVETYKRTGDMAEAVRESKLSAGEAKELVQTHPELREDIVSLLNRLGATPERIVREMARIAFVDVRRIVDENGRVKQIQDWDEDTARAVSGMDVTRRVFRTEDTEDEEITHKPRFWDKGQQLRELAKMQSIAGAETQRVGNVLGEKLRTEDEGRETREQVMLSLLALVQPRKDPEGDKGK